MGKMFQTTWTIRASIKTDDIQATFRKLTEFDIDIAGVNHKKSNVDVLVSDYEYKVLKNNFFDIKILDTKGVTAAPDTEYKTPDEIETLVKEFADKFPSITKVISIGKSVEGRDIWAIKISDNPESHETSEPAVLFNSMHHAREVMGPEVALDIIETLLNGYRGDAKITNWIDSNELWVIPMFNVDGNNKMWTKDRWWRKNNRGGYGVDLNRNYPAGWNKCNGSSGWKVSQTYRGPSPASEPETQAMMNFIKEVRPVFDISYHSYSELVIYPIGCKPERATNFEVIEKIGKQIGSLLNYKAGTAWELLYNADGGDIDWMYEAYQVIPYVIELNSTKEGFQPVYSKWRDVTVKHNRAGWQFLLERLEKSGIRGQVTKNNIAVKDFKIDIFKAGSTIKLQEYIGHASGMYYLILNPGEYNLVFKNAQGVFKKELLDVKNSLMELNISL